MTLAFDLSGGSRHFQSPTLRFSWEGAFRGGPTVHFRYNLSTCSPPLSEPTRLPPSRRGLVPPGFRRFGHPLRRRISLQRQLGNFLWRVSPLERQLASLQPLIELDRHISCIQLSEKGSRSCPRKADGTSIKTNQPKLVVQEVSGIPLNTSSLPFMFGAQPLAKPSASVSFHCVIGFPNRSQTKVIRPPNHDSIECRNTCFLGQNGLVPSGLLADRLADALHPFLRRSRS